MREDESERDNEDDELTGLESGESEGSEEADEINYDTGTRCSIRHNVLVHIASCYSHGGGE